LLLIDHHLDLETIGDLDLFRTKGPLVEAAMN